MKQTLHELLHYMGNDLHFRNAMIIESIVFMLGVIFAMIVCIVILIVSNNRSHRYKYSGSIEDLIDHTNRQSSFKIRRVKY